MEKIMFIFNSLGFAKSFTSEILEKFIHEKYEVVIVGNLIDDSNFMVDKNIRIINIDVNRRGTKIFEELKLYKQIKKIIKNEKPKLIFTFTIKPNIYGNLAANKYGIPVISRVSGLGSAFQKKNVIYYITKYLYMKSFKSVKHVFFENEANLSVFNKKIMKLKSCTLLPGSGVNITKFNYIEYPDNDDIVRFLFIGRIMKEKGIEEFLYVAEQLNNPDKVEFHVAGSFEEKYKNIFEKRINSKEIIYHGYVNDVKNIMSKMHCIILPSWHEGMSNVMLEAQSIGRPVIGSNVNGVKETFRDQISGLSFEVKNKNDLLEKVQLFLSLSLEEKREMGLLGRKHVIDNFNRDTVVSQYFDKCKEVLNE